MRSPDPAGRAGERQSRAGSVQLGSTDVGCDFLRPHRAFLSSSGCPALLLDAPRLGLASCFLACIVSVRVLIHPNFGAFSWCQETPLTVDEDTAQLQGLQQLPNHRRLQGTTQVLHTLSPKRLTTPLTPYREEAVTSPFQRSASCTLHCLDRVCSSLSAETPIWTSREVTSATGTPRHYLHHMFCTINHPFSTDLVSESSRGRLALSGGHSCQVDEWR